MRMGFCWRVQCCWVYVVTLGVVVVVVVVFFFFFFF